MADSVKMSAVMVDPVARPQSSVPECNVEIINIPIAAAKPTLKLDLACGQSVRQGFEGVDLYAPQAKHKVDLMKFPWPWADNSVEELHCSHFVEHLPAREVEDRDIVATVLYQGGAGVVPGVLDALGVEVSEKYVGKDFLFAFMDECYRIMAPDAWLQIICPAMPTDRAFQDPTHRRFLVEATFYYFNQLWRVGQRLDHYRVECDFEPQIMWTHDTLLNALHPEALGQRMRERYNQRVDWVVKLRAYKPRRIIIRDIQGGAVAGPPHASRFMRLDDSAPGTPWPHPCKYVFEVQGREEAIPYMWPPQPTA